MTSEPNIDDLWQDQRSALVAAYKRGFQAGAKAKSAEMMAILSGSAAAELAESPAPDVAEKPRAPKGLVGETLKAIFKEGDGFALKEIEERALAIDPRINRKTVYNELWRRPNLYGQNAGRWYKIDGTQHPPSSSPKGETGAAKPRFFIRPRPLQGITPSGDSAPTESEAGGT